MSKITLERYFYPVGQGLCCRERFIFNDDIDPKTGNPKEFNLVYDCGAWLGNIPKLYADKIIRKVFSGVKIDCIFISHFHNDHVNLLDTIIDVCGNGNIKEIRIPYISKAEKNILLFLDGNISNKKLLEAAQHDNEDERSKYREIDVCCNSFMNNKLSFWKYEPFGFNLYNRMKEFYKKISERGFVESDLEYELYVSKNKKELKSIYKSISGLNEQSTVLFSYPTGKIKITSFLPGFEFESLAMVKVGAIYFGDYPLFYYPNNIDNIYNQHKNTIGTVQIPHHGSNTGIYPPMYQKNTSYPISFGINNRYGHPKECVLMNICAMDGCPIFVTDFSGYSQHFEFMV